MSFRSPALPDCLRKEEKTDFRSSEDCSLMIGPLKPDRCRDCTCPRCCRRCGVSCPGALAPAKVGDNAVEESDAAQERVTIAPTPLPTKDTPLAAPNLPVGVVAIAAIDAVARARPDCILRGCRELINL